MSITDAASTGEDVTSPLGLEPTDLARLAARVNPRRPYLFVSTVLAKHLPVDPHTALAAGAALAVTHLRADGVPDLPAPDLLAGALRDTEQARALVESLPAWRPAAPVGTLVIGFAETATALGQAVADAMDGSTYIHTTREQPPAGHPFLEFTEDHSHAPEQRLLLPPGARDAPRGPVVIVDDEVSTGRTALNLIRALHARAPRDRYVILSLLDTLGEDDRRAVADTAARLGVEVSMRSLLSLPDGRDGIEGDLPAVRVPAAPPVVPGAGTPMMHRVDAGVPVNARRPRDTAERRALHDLARTIAARLEASRRGPAHILGTGEFMYLPLLVGSHMSSPVHVSSTTRSPVAVSADPGYPVARGVCWERPSGGLRYAYNAPATPDADVFVLLEAGVEADALRPMLGAFAAAGITDPHVVIVTGVDG